jgi:tetratricopeptide (TPR) repeat protein
VPPEPQQHYLIVPPDEAVIVDEDSRFMPGYEFPVGGDVEPIRFITISLRNVEVGEAWAEFHLGQQALENERLHDARQHFQSALDMVGEAALPPPLLGGLLQGRLSVVAAKLGDFKTAWWKGLVALDALNHLGVISTQLAIVLDNLALIEVQLGERSRSLEYLSRALAIKRVLLPPGDEQITYTEQVIEGLAGGSQVIILRNAPTAAALRRLVTDAGQ